MPTPDPAVDRLGISIEHLANDSWSASMTVSEDDTNSHGVCHGGIVFLLADVVFDRVTNSDLAEDRVAFAANASIEFIRPGNIGDTLTANGRATDRWGRSTLVDIVVTNSSNETVAHFRGKTRTVDTNR